MLTYSYNSLYSTLSSTFFCYTDSAHRDLHSFPTRRSSDLELLNNADFIVTEPPPVKPFAFDHRKMRTAYDFIEGYAGNDTVRGWRKYNSIYHSVFACVRGTSGYPKGLAHEALPSGLALRPAVPSPEI